MADPRRTRAWRKLRDEVVDDEPVCKLQLPGCTYWSQTADHILTVKEHPDLAMDRDNLQGACTACNNRRNDKPLDDVLEEQSAPALDWFR